MSDNISYSVLLGVGVAAVGGLVAWSYYNGSSEESVDSTDSIVKKDGVKDKWLEVAEKHPDAKVCMEELAVKYKLKEGFVEMLNVIEDLHVKGGDIDAEMPPQNDRMVLEEMRSLQQNEKMVMQEINTHHKNTISHYFEMMQEYSNFQKALVLDEENVSHNGNTMLMLMARENQLNLEFVSHIMQQASESYIKHVNKDGQTVVDLCKSPFIKGMIMGRLQELEAAKVQDVEHSEDATALAGDADQTQQPSAEELAGAEAVLHDSMLEAVIG